MLEECGERWFRARQLRSFIRACERELRENGDELPADSQAARWLSWARQHADQIDPIAAGYLENLKRKSRGADAL